LLILPNYDQRWIPDSKVRDYLLTTTTAKAKSRHDFFIRFGFSGRDWTRLRDALLLHVLAADIEVARQDQWGTTYRASGALATPDRRNPTIVAFWIIRADDPRPQLTSLVPSR